MRLKADGYHLMILVLKKMMSRTSVLAAFLLMVVSFSMHAEQAGTKVTDKEEVWHAFLEVKNPNVYLGLPMDLNIMSINNGDVPAPDLSHLEGFDIEVGPMSFVSTKGAEGQMFNYRLFPKKIGKIVLPEIALVKDDLSVRTKSMTINVLEPELSSEMSLKVTLSSQKVYEGQEVRLDFLWTTTYALTGIKSLRVVLPPLSNSQIKHLAPMGGVTEDSKNSVGLPVGGARVIGQWKDSRLRNKKAKSLKFSRVIIPQKAGLYHFDEVLLLASLDKKALHVPQQQKNKKNRSYSGFSYPSYFNNQFFELATEGSFKRVYAKFQLSPLEVLALPVANRPTNFNGLVGKPIIKVSCDDKEVKAGAPVQLEIEIRHPQLLSFELPYLHNQEAFTRNYRVPSNRSPAVYKNNAKYYQQTIWPSRAEVEMIPSINIAYFDPHQKRYLEVESNEIPITVKEGDALGALSGQFSEGLKLKSHIEDYHGGIYHNFKSKNLLIHERPHTGRWTFSHLWWSLFCAPVLICLVFIIGLFFLAHRRKNEKYYLAKAAYKNLQNALKRWQKNHSNDGSRLLDIVENYFRAKISLHQGHISWQEIKEGLNVYPCPEDCMHELEDWFAFHHRMCYAKYQEDDPPPSIESLNALLHQVERCIA
ncbi:MAG: BatD family protein [Planctomycetes bacterium]|nr:BatD family protein [Planctomycetota bacterium]